MLRRLYVYLIRLHPRSFRQRFGDEMLWIYDCSGARTWLVVDGLLSVLRQHILRPSIESNSGATSEMRLEGVPSFLFVDTSVPRASVLLQGAIATVLAWWVFSLGMQVEQQNITRERFLTSHAATTDAHQRRDSSRHAGHSAAAEQAKGATMPMREVRRKPHLSEPILDRLDSDQDRVISASEAAQAPHLLISLDINRDGR